ncbi:MAG: creatininase family protein [Chloroflexi bacterium]|nr:creatininase family protein [Chloroflexota bacterium]
MADLPRSLRLTHMTWPEVKAARDGVRLVAIPLGSIEQHGPNTSLDTDLVIAEDLTLRLAERFHPQILVAPTIPYGMSAYHMGFPGTVTLRAQTYLHVIEDNVTSLLHHGFDSFLFTNWHTGNESALILALQTLPARLPVRFMAGISLYDLEDETLAKRIMQSGTGGHADELETAELLAVRPDRVKTGALEAAALRGGLRSPRNRFWRRGIRMNTDFSDFTANGAVGDARLATVEDGREMIEAIERRADELIEQLLEAPEELIAQGRLLRWRDGTGGA